MTIDQQLQAAVRELGMRERCYPKWVAQGTLKADKAEHELKCMRAIIGTLTGLQALAGVVAHDKTQKQ